MALTREEVMHIAALAHLELSEAEIALYQEQLSAILAYAAALQQLDTADIPPTETALSVTRAPLREDEPEATLSPAEALHNAPARAKGCFVAPPTL